MRKKFVMLRVVLAAFFLLATVLPSQAAWYSVGKGSKYHFKTIQEAINDSVVVDGDTIWVSAGRYDGAIVNKGVKIIGARDMKKKVKKTFIQGKSIYGFILTAGADNATIKNFRFTKKVLFPVYARGVDNVTVDNNTLVSPVQGITNWNGNNWTITYNKIFDLGTGFKKYRNQGGAGIVVGAIGTDNKTANNNTIQFNKIVGKANVKKDGEYTFAAIVLADNSTTTTAKGDNASVTGNLVDNNTIDLTLKKLDGTAQLKGVFLNEVALLDSDGSIVGNTISDNVFGEGILHADALAEKPLMPKANTYSNNIDKATGATFPAPIYPADFDASLIRKCPLK